MRQILHTKSLNQVLDGSENERKAVLISQGVQPRQPRVLAATSSHLTSFYSKTFAHRAVSHAYAVEAALLFAGTW